MLAWSVGYQSIAAWLVEVGFGPMHKRREQVPGLICVGEFNDYYYFEITAGLICRSMGCIEGGDDGGPDEGLRGNR